MVEFSFGRGFCDLKLIKVGFLFSYSFNFVYKLESIIIFLWNHQTNVISSYINQLLAQYNLCAHHWHMFMNFPSPNQSQCINLNNFHLNLGQDQESSTLPCLHPNHNFNLILLST
jgi:hypothetical protein